MASRARQATLIAWRGVKTAPASPFRHQRHYSWKELKDLTLSRTGGKDCRGIFQWPYFYVILLFFAKALHLRKSFSVLFITDLNTALLVERSLTAAISYISSSSVMLECTLGARGFFSRWGRQNSAAKPRRRVAKRREKKLSRRQALLSLTLLAAGEREDLWHPG